MTDKEKLHEISVAYDSIEKVLRDTDEDLWAHHYLGGALAELEMYFEEEEM